MLMKNFNLIRTSQSWDGTELADINVRIRHYE